MSKLAVQNRPRSIFPELSEFFEGFPSWAHLRPAFGTHVIRVEDELKDGSYELRAEIPGVDPAKDVDITVRDGVLTIKASVRRGKSRTVARNSHTGRLSAGHAARGCRRGRHQGRLRQRHPHRLGAGDRSRTSSEARCGRVWFLILGEVPRLSRLRDHPFPISPRTHPQESLMSTEKSGHVSKDWTVEDTIDEHEGKTRARRSCAGETRSQWVLAYRGSIQRIAMSPRSATNWPSRARCPIWPDD